MNIAHELNWVTVQEFVSPIAKKSSIKVAEDEGEVEGEVESEVEDEVEDVKSEQVR